MTPSLSEALALAAGHDTRREYSEAARILDEAITMDKEAPGPLRFRALLLRSDIAVSMNDPGEGRGILAEARQIPLTAPEREALAADLRRADDLEAFFTHRGCAG